MYCQLLLKYFRGDKIVEYYEIGGYLDGHSEISFLFTMNLYIDKVLNCFSYRFTQQIRSEYLIELLDESLINRDLNREGVKKDGTFFLRE